MFSDPMFWVMAVLLFAGFFMLRPTVQDWLRVRTARRWPQTHAEVVQADFEAVPPEGLQRYDAKVAVAFELAGRRYKVNRTPRKIFSGGVPRKQAQRLQQAYSPGQQVVVHYNPHDPNEAYIGTPGRDEMWQMVTLTITIVVALAYMALSVAGAT